MSLLTFSCSRATLKPSNILKSVVLVKMLKELAYDATVFESLRYYCKCLKGVFHEIFRVLLKHEWIGLETSDGF
jgi:hypothetical protein